MSLIPCKSCKKEVAHNAKTCPHCGVKNPGVTSKQMLIGLAVLAGAAAMVAVSCGSNEEEIKAIDAACMQDLECIGNKGTVAAGTYCPQHIEKLAKNSVKWTDGTLEPKFSRFRWKDKQADMSLDGNTWLALNNSWEGNGLID